MGCAAAKPSLNLDQEYKTLNLPMPDATAYENDFEKEAFMTLNLLRHNPKKFIPNIKELKSNSKLYKGKNWALLLRDLEKQEQPLPSVAFDKDAT